jgi:hypothetical protein
MPSRHRRRPQRRKPRQFHDCQTTGKRSFGTELAARAALASAQSVAAVGDRRETRFYRCPDCNRFHLTSAPAREGQTP